MLHSPRAGLYSASVRCIGWEDENERKEESKQGKDTSWFPSSHTRERVRDFPSLLSLLSILNKVKHADAWTCYWPSLMGPTPSKVMFQAFNTQYQPAVTLYKISTSVTLSQEAGTLFMPEKVQRLLSAIVELFIRLSLYLGQIPKGCLWLHQQNKGSHLIPWHLSMGSGKNCPL